MQRKIASIILIIGNMFALLTLWLMLKYDNVTIDQFLYQLKSSAAGVDHSLGISATISIIFGGLVLSYLELRIYSHNLRPISFFKKHGLLIACLIFCMSLMLLGTKLRVVTYANSLMDESMFIENHYVSPDEVEITFPDKKRNLIYIYLESMETSYADTKLPSISDNYIKELNALADENLNFSNTDGFGGALSVVGTTWTAASMVAQTTGVNLKVPLNQNYRGQDYMPGIITLGDILKDAGYNQTLLLGSDASFANRDTYFKNHGDYRILDINSLKADGKLSEQYRVWWGFEDIKLFEFAKTELLELAKKDEPFNFTMLTADTHFPDGYVCPKCQNLYDNQYANVISCSSREVSEFVKWIQNQDFYENTTIVLCGDHLTMDPNFFKDLQLDYTRTIYNCFINSPIEAIQSKNRNFGVIDMFPTTLRSLGVTIEGDYLGLGVNLFSDKQSLIELYGYNSFNEELNKRSEYYEERFFEAK